MVPAIITLGWVPDAAAADNVRTALSIGLMIGAGLGIFFKIILPKAKAIYGPMFSRNSGKMFRSLPILIAALVYVVAWFTEMSLITTVIAVIATWLTTAMATYSTGICAVDPCDTFAMMAMILARLIVPDMGRIEAILFACFVCVACGLAADAGNDFKAGSILRTDPIAQLIVETLGGLVGAVTATFVLFALVNANGAGPGSEYMAPQAAVFAGIFDGLPYMGVFYAGVVIGCVLQMVNLPGMIIGFGAYLPVYIGVTIFLGGFLSFIVKKIATPAQLENGTIIASGLIAGESLVGVIIALIRLGQQAV
jgi:uncharacterized oligopeptide transporter (OPT) family protein